MYRNDYNNCWRTKIKENVLNLKSIWSGRTRYTQFKEIWSLWEDSFCWLLASRVVNPTYYCNWLYGIKWKSQLTKFSPLPRKRWNELIWNCNSCSWINFGGIWSDKIFLNFWIWWPPSTHGYLRSWSLLPSKWKSR